MLARPTWRKLVSDKHMQITSFKVNTNVPHCSSDSQKDAKAVAQHIRDEIAKKHICKRKALELLEAAVELKRTRAG